MRINFECKKCCREFDCEVGDISLSDDGMRPVFEKNIICPSAESSQWMRCCSLNSAKAR